MVRIQSMIITNLLYPDGFTSLVEERDKILNPYFIDLTVWYKTHPRENYKDFNEFTAALDRDVDSNFRDLISTGTEMTNKLRKMKTALMKSVVYDVTGLVKEIYTDGQVYRSNEASFQYRDELPLLFSGKVLSSYFFDLPEFLEMMHASVDGQSLVIFTDFTTPLLNGTIRYNLLSAERLNSSVDSRKEDTDPVKVILTVPKYDERMVIPQKDYHTYYLAKFSEFMKQLVSN